jgi:hypothetical protein
MGTPISVFRQFNVGRVVVLNDPAAGRTLTLALEAIDAGDAAATVTVALTQGALPAGATLTNPETAVNAPSTTFSWTPNSAQQCEYQLCFTGTSSSGVVTTGAYSDPADTGVDGRGLHSIRFQLNLSSSVHRVTPTQP